MRENPFYGVYLLLTGGLGDQSSLGDLRWITTGIYWLLLVSGLIIAAINWQRDPSQRTFHHIATAGLRFWAAGMWYVNSLWKLPLPVSPAFQDWLAQTVKYSSFQIHADIMQFFLDRIEIAGPLVYLLEVALAASLMLGFLVRLSNWVGALFIFNLMIGLFNAPTEWVWTYVGLICTFCLFALNDAGKSLGLDNIFAKRLLPVVASDAPLVKAVRALS